MGPLGIGGELQGDAFGVDPAQERGQVGPLIGGVALGGGLRHVRVLVGFDGEVSGGNLGRGDAGKGVGGRVGEDGEGVLFQLGAVLLEACAHEVGFEAVRVGRAEFLLGGFLDFLESGDERVLKGSADFFCALRNFF